MGDTQLELVCNRGDPGIILCFKHLFRTSQIQITYRDTQICIGQPTIHCRRKYEYVIIISLKLHSSLFLTSMDTTTIARV